MIAYFLICVVFSDVCCSVRQLCYEEGTLEVARVLKEEQVFVVPNSLVCSIEDLQENVQNALVWEVRGVGDSSPHIGLIARGVGNDVRLITLPLTHSLDRATQECVLQWNALLGGKRVVGEELSSATLEFLRTRIFF